jgi:transcriptional regulator with XRE-family HTH domain
MGQTTEDGATALGEWIRKRRQALDLSRRDVAERMTKAGEYTDPGYLSQLERGRVRLPRKYLNQLAAALEVSRQDILIASGYVDPADSGHNPFPAGTLHHELFEHLVDLDDQQVAQMIQFAIELSRQPTKQGT